MKEFRLIFIVIIVFSFLLFKCQNKNKNISKKVAFKKSMEHEEKLEFKLLDLTGKTISLSDYKGKIVLVNFWATWCIPCIKELPSMVSLKNKLMSKDFEILAINVDKASNFIKVKEMVKATKLQFPVLLDSKVKVATKYKINAIPYSYIIGRDGRTLTKYVGFLEWDKKNVVSYFKKLLIEKSVKFKK